MNTQYQSIIDMLNQMSPSRQPATSLESAIQLHTALGFPAHAYPVIHVAGSNGKGSVATKMAKVLELSGYKVGLYTSPHLKCFRERIVINEEMISEDAVVTHMQKLKTHFHTATFFELATFLAFEYFRSEKVDIAVIETGIGGRYDATNVVNSCMTVITSISREHHLILGDDLEKIAHEKAGIIKPGIPIVIGPKARFQAIYDQASHSPLYASKKISYFYDEENAAIAELALSHLPFPIIPEALAAGLSIRPRCRFESQEDVILDVAHNPDAVFHLIQALHTFHPERKLRFLVGFSKDKEIDACLEHISTVATHIHLVQAPFPKAATPEDLEKHLSDSTAYTKHCDIKQGMEAALERANAENELLIVCGSFYIMQSAKEVIAVMLQ